MKIYLDTVGCRLNQAEIEQYARQFRAAGHHLVSTSQEADLAVVNTCAVTAAAASDSRGKVRQLHRAGVGEIVVTGCWSTLHPVEASTLPGVKVVVDNARKDNLVSEVLGLAAEEFDTEPMQRQRVPGARLRTRAFIKVQDGCDNRCTFCVTTLARGAGRSRTIEQVLADVRAALQGDDQGDLLNAAREIVLTGVHLGAWGKDFNRPRHLSELVEAVLAETDVPRLRLSSLEPWDLDGQFFALWQDERLCRHLHLPLQSGSAATLRRMARKTTPGSFSDLVQAARQSIPGVAITTDLITGFPGESEAEFQETLSFVEEMEFAGGHVFTYSARSGTAAARMPEQVPETLRKARNAQLRVILQAAGAHYRQSFVGQTLAILWESAAALGPLGWEMSGLSDNYLRVKAHAPRHLWNQITPVRMLGSESDGLIGQVLT